MQAAEAARLAFTTADCDKVSANHELEKADAAEAAAADRFHEAQDKDLDATPWPRSNGVKDES